MTYPMTEKMTGSVDAMMKSGEIWSSGFQEYSKTCSESAQSHVDDNFSYWSKMKDVKTFKEATEIQTDFNRSYFEKAVAEMSKMTKAFTSLSERAFEPIKTFKTREKAANPGE